MTKRLPSLFYADNKDIADHLNAHDVFRAEKLREIARKRGIILSSRASKANLVEYVSLMSFDRDQLDELLDSSDSGERQGQYAIQTMSVAVAQEDVESAAEVVKKARASLNEPMQITRQNDNTVRVEMTYSELDSKRNRLDQKVVRTAVVVLETEAGALRVRSTAGKKGDELAAGILSAIKKEQATDESQEPLKISLAGYRDAKARTAFFLKLFKGVKEFVNTGVSDVRVSHLDDEDADDNDEAESDDSGKPSVRRKEDVQMKGAIRSAILEGQNLLQSNIYQQLTREGYYVTKAIWQVRNAAALEVDFEAAFHDAKQASDFRYRVRRAFAQELHDQEIVRRPADPSECERLTRLLEDAARQAQSDVSVEFGEKRKAEKTP